MRLEKAASLKIAISLHLCCRSLLQKLASSSEGLPLCGHCLPSSLLRLQSLSLKVDENS